MNWVVLLSSLLVLAVKNSPEAFALLPCNEKGFVCLGKYQFYQCILGDNKLYLANVMNCPKGMACSDEDDLECDREE